MPIPTTDQNPALACDLTQDEALALLDALSAKHGPGLLATLVGAALAADVREAAGDPTDADDQPSFDLGWLTAFAEHPAFVQGLGAEAAFFDDGSWA
jgi:hypothetical protein